ncbi:SDR family oxidoreductase [Marinilabilia sp.]|uniref:SDR family NAD(P)-dependent oxidoreductase n=1 Tax=Marinilabilia sp. TaxID=2021252 RepID=UPI0025BF90B2|nr:SDR family oxidoreductase [Marinilabilia sp.]
MAEINELFNLKNKNAIVTGGYGYLGKGIVDTLRLCGCNVIVAGRSKEKFNNAFANYSEENLHFHKIDIMSSESIEDCFAGVQKKVGDIDILINNAHSAIGNSQENMSDEDWNYTMEGVVGSVHKSIRTIIPYMKKQGRGKIINISSMYGLVSPDFETLYFGNDCEKYTNPPHYGAAKAAMIQLTRYYAVLLGKYNIYVNSVSPGPFPKESIQNENPEFLNRLKNKNPLKKVGEPKDLAGVIAILSSSASDFITGQTFQVDGGWTIW